MSGVADTRFPAFRHVNFRYYAVGQLASIAGTWLQNVALAWLVLQRTGSGTDVGIVSAAMFVPSLLFGAWAGAVADRFDARRTVIVLQALLGAQALALAVLVSLHAESMWSLVALALWNGVGGALDRPVRQTLLNELVGDEELPNAIATNSALVQLGLVVGPAVGAVLIRTVGIAWCFAVNAASYAVLLGAIAMIRPSTLIVRPRPVGVDTSVRAGFAHLRTRADIRLLLSTLAVGSLLAYRVDVLLPILARDLGGGSGLFAALTTVRGVGALFASLFLASRFGAPSFRLLRNASALMAVSLAAMAVPVPAVVLVAVFPAGIGFMGSIVSTLSLTQLLASPAFRGRLVAVWFVVLSGGVVFGSLLSGVLADAIGERVTMLIGAASLVFVTWLVRAAEPSTSVPSTSVLATSELPANEASGVSALS